MKTSRKVEANRNNAQKSTGPRTGAGKRRSSRNAVRHGLTSQRTAPSEAINRIADELCKEDPFPYRQHYAMVIAEAQVSLEQIRNARIQVIERLRKVRPPVIGLLNRAGHLIETRDIKGLIALLRHITAVNKELLRLMKAGESTLPKVGIVAEYFAEHFLSKSRSVTSLPGQRTDLECILRAIPELVRLERYERRALARRRKAIRAFAARLDT